MLCHMLRSSAAARADFRGRCSASYRANKSATVGANRSAAARHSSPPVRSLGRYPHQFYDGGSRASSRAAVADHVGNCPMVIRRSRLAETKVKNEGSRSVGGHTSPKTRHGRIIGDIRALGRAAGVPAPTCRSIAHLLVVACERRYPVQNSGDTPQSVHVRPMSEALMAVTVSGCQRTSCGLRCLSRIISVFYTYLIGSCDRTRS